MSVIAEIRNDLEKGAIQLMVEYRERLRVEAVKLCQDATLAEDLVFRTFEKVLSHAEGFQDGTNLFAWMKTIMTNLYRNDIKRPVVRGTTVADAAEIEQCAGVDWSTDEEILRNSDSEAIREAIQGLGPIYKEPLLKRYYDGLTLKEIAEIMRLPIGTVSRRLHVAHHLLAGKLSAKFGRLKKPLAVLVGALVLVGAAFASWTTGFFGLLPEREPEALAEERRRRERRLQGRRVGYSQYWFWWWRIGTGGRLLFRCWRQRHRDPALHLAEARLRDHHTLIFDESRRTIESGLWDGVKFWGTSNSTFPLRYSPQYDIIYT